MKWYKAGAGLTLAAVLAGCSAQASTSASSASAPAPNVSASPSAPASSTSAAPAPTGDPLADAATRLGCTGWVLSSEAAPYVDRWGECQLDGQRVQLYLVASDDAYRSFVQSVAGFGVTEAQLVHVGSIIAAPADQTKLDQIRAALAG